jgi:peptidoglycan/xylan/chitin deacetylase (PgdA/CDA1 family)
VHPYYQINTSPDIFVERMRFLHENNYSVISLAKAVKMLDSNSQPNQLNTQHATRNTQIKLNQPLNHSTNQPLKYVVLTFDDGFRDFYTQAFPILQKYGFTATVFLPTGFIDNKGLKLKGKEHLNWIEVRELHNNGINFGSHTVTHPQLKLLKKEDIEYEIRQSKETIQNKLGESIDSFSYPFKFPEEDKEFTKYLRVILQKFGYKYSVSTRIGTTSKKDDIFFLKRIPANSCDDISLFKAKLQGGYDWLYWPQYFLKMAKRIYQ